MAERLIIEGNTVTRVREEIVSTTTLQDLIQQTQRVLETPILPNNCILYRRNGDAYTLVIQHAPQKRTINIKVPNGRGGTTIEPYDLELPWMVNVHYVTSRLDGGRPVFRHGGMKSTFRPRRLLDADRVLKCSVLPNVWSDTGAVCLGYQLDGSTTQSLQEMVTMAEGCLFSTDFNQEINPDPAAFELLGGSYAAWSQLTSSQVLAAVNNPRWTHISSDW